MGPREMEWGEWRNEFLSEGVNEAVNKWTQLIGKWVTEWAVVLVSEWMRRGKMREKRGMNIVSEAH